MLRVKRTGNLPKKKPDPLQHSNGWDTGEEPSAPTARWARAKLWNAARVGRGKGFARWRDGKMVRGGARQGRALGRRGPTDRTRPIYRGCAAVGCRRGCGASATSSWLQGERKVSSVVMQARRRCGCGASPRSSRVRGEHEVGAAAVRARGRRCYGASATSATSSRGRPQCERERVARGWSKVGLRGKERGEPRSWSKVRVAQLERGEPSEAR
jgi:hypothetical protein